MAASIVQSSDDAIVSKNLDVIITSWNRGAERIFGYSPEEAIGQPITMIIPKGRYDEEREICSVAMAAAIACHSEATQPR